MANTIEYADSPNVDTAFVVQEGGQKNRAVLTAPQDTTTLELPDNPNSTKGYVTVDGKKHKVILTADISGNGGGGGGAVDSVNGKTGVVVLDATDVGAVPQYETMPTADASNADLIVQFVGATDTYTNGYFYKCVSDGEATPTYSWVQISVQPSPDPLPSQTGQSGKFLTTDGTDASWATINALQNQGTVASNLNILGDTGVAQIKTNATSIGYYAAAKNDYSTAIGALASCDYDYAVALGASAYAAGNHAVAIGANAEVAYGVAHAIQIGATTNTSGPTTNSDANTFKVANANGNFEMMNANGNLPADRLASTTGLADGNYRLRLTMSNGVPTLTWVAE